MVWARKVYTMEETYVTLAQLSTRLQMDRSQLRKYVLRKGVAWQHVRTPDSHGQVALALTTEAAEHLIALRAEEGFVPGRTRALPVPTEDRGVCYIVQLVPDLAPGRLKVGFAADLAARLAAHRTAAPTAVVLETWPCKRVWEATALDALTACDCTMIGPEVFDCLNIDTVIARGHAFFALLPSLS
jgi:hypothetical protein